MRYNESYERSSTFAVLGQTLLIPASEEPKVGMWKMGEFLARYAGSAKTSCAFTQQTNYYLPGNNRRVHLDVTVEECKQLCCEEDLCQSFDYARRDEPSGLYLAKTCWTSRNKEGSAGLTWDDGNTTDYYEIAPTEVISRLAVLDNNDTTLVLGSAKHSGNIYQYTFQLTNGRPDLSPLGVYAGGGGHSAPILAMKVVNWASGLRLFTAGYDRKVISWVIDGSGTLSRQATWTDYSWPIWSIEAGADEVEGIFIAGEHASIARENLAANTKQSLRGHSRLVRCLAYDSSHSILASGSEDTRIILWRRVAGSSAGDFELGARLFDHTAAVTSLTFATLTAEPMLISSGDDGHVMIFDPRADETTCDFEKQNYYYLPGNNRYIYADSTLAECMRICCESDWCASFDYATEADPGGLHGANTCWMSSYVEGPSGLQWDSSGIYHYYEVAKRGTRMLKIDQPGPIAAMDYVPAPTSLMIVEHAGDASNPGGLVFLKLQEVTCPDGSAPNYEGTECALCRLGFAGTGGICLECPPGRYAPGEGSLSCEDCPKGYASSITDAPSNNILNDLWGLVKCTECPKWALATVAGQTFCEWCPPGQFPDSDRMSCLEVGRGVDSNAGRTSWAESWYRDGNEMQDAFCPTGNTGESLDNCLYPPQTVTEAVCPMTCPLNYQVEVDDHWNPEGCRSGLRGCTSFADVSWRCLIQNRTAQEKCNQLLCMGAIVSMQGLHEKTDCVKDRTDCTCAENVRESCMGGLKRLRDEQCRSQCTQRWCDLMCQRERSREYTGIFRPDNVENPFEVLRCEAKGTTCTATCRNDQRRLAVARNCGEFDIWDDSQMKYLIRNDALCGTEGVYETRQETRSDSYGRSYTSEVEVYVGARQSEQVCLTGTMGRMRYPTSTEFHVTYRPSSCVASAAQPLSLGLAAWLPLGLWVLLALPALP